MIGNWMRLDSEEHGTFRAPWTPPAEGPYKIWILDDRGREIATQAHLNPEMRVLSPGGWFDDTKGMRIYTLAEFGMSSGGRVITDLDPDLTIIEWRST